MIILMFLNGINIGRDYSLAAFVTFERVVLDGRVLDGEKGCNVPLGLLGFFPGRLKILRGEPFITSDKGIHRKRLLTGAGDDGFKPGDDQGQPAAGKYREKLVLGHKSVDYLICKRDNLGGKLVRLKGKVNGLAFALLVGFLVMNL